MTTLSNPDNRQKVATNHLWWVTLVAIITAVIGNVILYFIGGAVVEGGLLVVPAGATEPIGLPLGLVVGATAVPAVVGAILLALLNRTLRPITIFRWIAAVFTVLSFAPVFQLPASVTMVNKIVLALMHVVAAVAIAGILTTFGRARS